MKSSPTNAPQVECVDPTLLIRRQYLSDRFVSRTLQLSSHPLWSLLNVLSQLHSPNKPPPALLDSFLHFTILPHPLIQLPLNPIFSTSYKALIYQPIIITNLGFVKGSPNTLPLFNSICQQNWSDYLLIYTDASKLSPSGCVGSACWITRYKNYLKFQMSSRIFSVHRRGYCYIRSYNVFPLPQDKTDSHSDGLTKLPAGY